MPLTGQAVRRPQRLIDRAAVHHARRHLALRRLQAGWTRLSCPSSHGQARRCLGTCRRPRRASDGRFTLKQSSMTMHHRRTWPSLDSRSIAARHVRPRYPRGVSYPLQQVDFGATPSTGDTSRVLPMRLHKTPKVPLACNAQGTSGRIEVRPQAVPICAHGTAKHPAAAADRGDWSSS